MHDHGTTKRSRLLAAVIGFIVLEGLAVLAMCQRYRSSEPGAHHLEVLHTSFVPADRLQRLHTVQLIDQDGRPFGIERVLGRWNILFVGYTSCPDVCPTTLQVLASLAQMPESGVRAGHTQLIFVSVDPNRDTPDHLKAYLAHFDGQLIGLTGHQSHIDRLANALGAAYTLQGKGHGFQFNDHSTSLFLLDPQGIYRGTFLRPADPQRILHDLEAVKAHVLSS
jgi:protein SCO1/2